VARKGGEALMVDYLKEITKLLKVLRKLDHPPSAPNWVRFIFDDVERTAKAILRFAKGQPPFNYQAAYIAIRDRIELGIELEAAIRVATSKGSPAGWTQNKELVEAFFEYDEGRKFSASNAIGFDREYFRVSRDVLVPVAPVSIIREKGQFIPIFVCGWTTNTLTLLQRRLLATVTDDAFLSLTDYQASPSEYLFFPKEPPSGSAKKREAEVWLRGDYELLSKAALDECVEIFVSARDMARQILLDEIEHLRAKAKEQAERAQPRRDQPDDLFPKK
jgi:hypothetical protein